jgi:predicted metal-binding protein/2-polyprenyl-3-methyl-5-hydroxy-6-metoxy-1,4-benzoquinol methylase
MDIFTRLEPDGATLEELALSLDMKSGGLERFLHALGSLGLVGKHDGKYFNSKVARDYLVRGKAQYQGDSVLWRKYLRTHWQGFYDCLKAGGKPGDAWQASPSERAGRITKYVRAMDCVAKTKGEELTGFFEAFPMNGRLLDVGAGSGAIAALFLKRYTGMSATLLDLPQVLEKTRAHMRGSGLAGRVRYRPGNILEPWPVRKGWFDLVILSNILHAYSENELPGLLASASAALKKTGILLIHDFFFEHHADKAALTDLNMFINTFNGRVFSGKLVLDKLRGIGLSCTGLVPLETDTAIIFASKDEAALGPISIDAVSRLISKTKSIGFEKIYRLDARDIKVADWPGVKCQFGCGRYGASHCPPNAPTPRKTRSILKDYSRALLLEGGPPTGDFQRLVLRAEREAFVGGFQKAFSFWAGPCSLCDSCAPDGKCRNTKNARPSMEGAGIDVFETVKRAGASVRTLGRRDDFVKYFALLLLE